MKVYPFQLNQNQAHCIFKLIYGPIYIPLKIEVTKLNTWKEDLWYHHLLPCVELDSQEFCPIFIKVVLLQWKFDSSVLTENEVQYCLYRIIENKSQNLISYKLVS